MDIDEAITAAAALRTQGAYGEARSLLHAALTETGLSGAEQARLHYQLAWCCDAAGEEAAAVPFYKRALALGLAGEERSGALLGLGSTYRALGRYADAERTLALATASPTVMATIPRNSDTRAAERSTSSSNSTIEAMNTSRAG